MASQNIFNYYGIKLDGRVDFSELYDYEITKNNLDYNSDVIEFNNPLTYTSLTINSDLSGFTCIRDSITINDGTTNYSIDYNDFVNFFGNPYEYTILNNDVYVNLDGITYYTISGYNDPINTPSTWLTTNLSGSTIECLRKLSNSSNCCPPSPQLENKPWAYKFDTGGGGDYCSPYIKRRTEKGWTLDFIFNREHSGWTAGSVFYYIGVRGEDDITNYADNNLSFQFTPDGRIKWVSVRYSGVCNPATGYSDSYYIESGQTPTLCTTADDKDFNVSIVFDRDFRLTDCNIENDGGWNDLIQEFNIVPTQNTDPAITSTQIVTYNTYEELNKKWEHERKQRLGTLKIYLNGHPIYKIKEWEEIIPSKRGVQPFIQSWGGGTGLMGGIHEGTCCFDIKSIKYYEEPLDYFHIRHNFLMSLKSGQYDYFICGPNCVENTQSLKRGVILNNEGFLLATQDHKNILYRI